MAVNKVGFLSWLVEKSETVGYEEVGEFVRFVVVFVQVVISGPDGVVEVEVSEEEGVGIEGLNRLHGFDSGVVDVVVDVEDEERGGR